jgi:nitrate/nitrite transport system ATP-binding protein
VSAFVELFNLGKAYQTPRGRHVVVRDFHLRMAKGEVVALIGHSGCGKSTVLTMIAGLTETSEGSIGIDNREISGPGPDRGVVFQSPCLLPWMSAFDNVMLGVERVYPEASPEERRQMVRYYLARVGLAEAADKLPRELSQGMRQRVGIARACALSPRMLLLDEPFGMLDSLTRMELQEMLLQILDRDRITALMVTHDVDEALFVADRVVMMTNGPEARVGDVMDVPFPRPRVRRDVLEHPRYYELRERLITFLEEQERRRPGTHGLEAESAASKERPAEAPGENPGGARTGLLRERAPSG